MGYCMNKQKIQESKTTDNYHSKNKQILVTMFKLQELMKRENYLCLFKYFECLV